MIRKVLCLLGFHKWRSIEIETRRVAYSERVHLVWHDDVKVCPCCHRSA